MSGPGMGTSICGVGAGKLPSRLAVLLGSLESTAICLYHLINVYTNTELYVYHVFFSTSIARLIDPKSIK